MIEVSHLVKTYDLPGGRTLRAVDDISLTVREGEVYGLLGPNGAGKTTTLRILLGLLAPTSGSTRIDGWDSQRDPDEVKRRVGFVSAHAGVYQHLSVRELLLYFADLYGLTADSAQSELIRVSGLFGLSEFLDQPCTTLSTGQKQRVNLARALVHQPPVVLLDEPTLGLDVWGSKVIYDFVTHLQQERKAVIITTHHLDDAERLCTRLGLMHRGKIIREGTLSELQAQTGRRSLVEMFFDLSPDSAPTAV